MNEGRTILAKDYDPEAMYLCERCKDTFPAGAFYWDKAYRKRTDEHVLRRKRECKPCNNIVQYNQRLERENRQRRAEGYPQESKMCKESCQKGDYARCKVDVWSPTWLPCQTEEAKGMFMGLAEVV